MLLLKWCYPQAHCVIAELSARVQSDEAAVRSALVNIWVTHLLAPDSSLCADSHTVVFRLRTMRSVRWMSSDICYTSTSLVKRILIPWDFVFWHL
jgi:hypothetical protein